MTYPPAYAVPVADDAPTYTLELIDGRLHACWPDGKLLPVVSGGAVADDDSDGEDGSGGDDSTAGAGGGGASADADGAGGATGGDDGGDQVTMSQADLDALVDKRLGRARRKWQDELSEYARREGLDDVDRLKVERDDAVAAGKANADALTGRLIRTEAKAAALAAGVHPDRIGRLLRLVDLDDVDELVDDDGVDEAAVARAVQAALADVPELAASSNGGGKAGSSGGDFTGGGSGKQWTADEVKALSDEDFEKHEAEIMAQMSAGKLSR